MNEFQIAKQKVTITIKNIVEKYFNNLGYEIFLIKELRSPCYYYGLNYSIKKGNSVKSFYIVLPIDVFASFIDNPNDNKNKNLIIKTLNATCKEHKIF